MATKLQCEICGGRLIGKAGGVFECDSCGMEYDTSWVKEKIQEIRGTVKVEGTVEVTGTVQMDTSANRDALLKRAFMMLEEGNWEKADERLEQVLNIDPECGEAYLGKLMVELKIKAFEELKNQPQPFDIRSNYQKAMRFGDTALKTKLSNICELYKTAHKEVFLFTFPGNQNCKIASILLEKSGVSFATMDANTEKELVEKYGIRQVPTLIFLTDGGFEKYCGVSDIKVWLIRKNV